MLLDYGINQAAFSCAGKFNVCFWMLLPEGVPDGHVKQICCAWLPGWSADPFIT